MTNTAFSKVIVDVLEVIGDLMMPRIILTFSACLTVQGQKVQLNGSLENCS